jgi:hypothetical protein
MYPDVFWDNVNSIMGICTYIFIPNTKYYLCTLAYTDVFGVKLN